MKNVLLVAVSLIVFANSLQAQGDFFDILSSDNYTHDIIEGVSIIEELEYTQSFDETFDTILVVDGDSLLLSLSSKRLTTFEDPYNYTTEHFEDGEVAFTEVVGLNKKGLQIYTEVNFADENLGQYMNEKKETHYDENERITKVIGFSLEEGESELLSLNYTEEGMLESGYMDAGVMKMKIMSSQHDDTTRLKIEPDMTGMEELFGSMPQNRKEEYYDILKNEETGSYSFHLTEKDTLGNTKVTQIISRNENFQMIESKDIGDDGGINAHFSYEYKDGKLKKITNVLENEVMENEYDEEGRKTIEYSDYNTHYYDYDKKGNVTRIKTEAYDEVSTIIIKQINYSK